MNWNLPIPIWVYLIPVNIAAFALYGIDKQKAKLGMWRIPEKTLLGIAIAGGSIGAIAGMNFFHHKTKHVQFRYGLPIILALQIAAVIRYLIKS